MASDTVKIVECPKCKQMTMECHYVEDGSPLEFWDNFSHKCLNPACGHTESKVEFGGSTGYESPWPKCPFCKRQCP